MNTHVRKKDKLQFLSLAITALLLQQCSTCKANVRECNSTQGTFVLEGTSDVVSYHNNTCMNGRYIFKQFESGEAQVVIIRFQCSSRKDTFGVISLLMPERNECWPPEGETFDSGCLAFVRNSTLDSRLSLVNVSGCTLVVLQNGTPMEIVFFNTDVSTFMLNYTLLQRVGQEENSEPDLTQPSNNITDAIPLLNPILSNDDSEQIPRSNRGVQTRILTIVGAVVFAFGLLAVGLGLAWKRRVKRTPPEPRSTRDISATNTIVPYYETSVTSANSPIYENSEIISLSQDAYIEPECNVYFDPNYENTSPVEAGGFYEPVQQTEVTYLTPISRGADHGESRYQYQLKGRDDDAGYMQVNYTMT